MFDLYESYRREKVELNDKMIFLRNKMAFDMPEGTTKIKLKDGYISRYNQFVRWEFTKDLEKQIDFQKKSGLAKRVQKETIVVKVSKKKKESI